MLHKNQLITVNHGLWEAVGRHAAAQGMTPESWMRRQLERDASSAEHAAADDADERLLDLVLRHFRDLGMSPADQQALADAVTRTLNSGEPRDIGPVGRLQRCYRLRRRHRVVRIELGEGAVSLPLSHAARLAALLGTAGSLQFYDNAAA
ncbi:MAG: hypothetical protein QNJ91_14870 [Gammaproteobacteria bacterium]|nr:hypothetical protein [Gammaproteobacteria bacterium]